MNQPFTSPSYYYQNFQQGYSNNNYQLHPEYYYEPDPKIQFAPPIELLLSQNTGPELPSGGSNSYIPQNHFPTNDYQGIYNPNQQYYQIQNNNYYPQYQQQPGNFAYANNNSLQNMDSRIPAGDLSGKNTKLPIACTNPTKTTTRSSKKGSYFSKLIENEMVLRSDMIGEIGSGQHEFDDYFETHIEKFFTPEIHQIVFFHDDYNLIGLQTTYRDPWGTMLEKETYLGDLHLSKNICGYYNKTTLSLSYDEYLIEVYIDAHGDRVAFVKLVTNNGQVLTLGLPKEGTPLTNLAVPSTRVMGFGGSYDIYLRSLYLYYN